MDADESVVPDAIEPIILWRRWRYDATGHRLASWIQHYVWPPAECVATCRRAHTSWSHVYWCSPTPAAEAVPPPQHRAPDENCVCGIYGLYSLAGLFEELTPHSAIIGRIAAYGKVIRGRGANGDFQGARCERARVIDLYVFDGRTSVGLALHRTYGVPVAIIPQMLGMIPDPDHRIGELARWLTEEAA
jgi:hypothetical protein